MPPSAILAAARTFAFHEANRLYHRWPSLYRRLFYLYKRSTDRSEINEMRRLVRPGMTCVDVGANIGFYTEFLGRLVGPSGKVIAFEPSVKNFQALGSVLGPHIRAVRAAVGAATGHVTLYESDDMNVDHRTYPVGGVRTQSQVPVVRLDDALGETNVDFVKMDIQGYELHALRGMPRILKDSRRLSLLLEFWPWGIREAGGTPEDVIALLEHEGFLVRFLTGEPVKEWVFRPDWYTNILAIRR